MKRYEYKVEYLKLKIGSSREDQVLDEINVHGRDGWRLNRLFADLRLRTFTSWKGGINLLLEREIAE